MNAVLRYLHHPFSRSLWESFSIALPVAFWLWLAYRQIVDHLHTLNPMPVLVAAQSLLAACLLLKRKEDTSKRFPWYGKAAIIFTAFLGPLCIEQKLSSNLLIFWPVVTVSSLGLLLVLWALASLGVSFGIAPADRGLVKGGPYRFIRHPMYVGTFLNVVAVVFANPTVWNCLVLAGMLLIHAYRIYLEERTVTGYAQYAREAPWRFIPGVF